jgi:hypothetical protein
VFDADVAVADSKLASSNILGTFRVRSVPAGAPVPVQVRVPGYLPYSTMIAAERDTTLRIDLIIDPVSQRMLAAQVERLRKRSQGVNARLELWNGDALARAQGQTLSDYMQQRHLGKPACFFVDDANRTAWLPDVLTSYLINELDRIEAYDRGLMLRVYTRRYIAKQSNAKALPSIVYMRMGLASRPVCM